MQLHDATQIPSATNIVLPIRDRSRDRAKRQERLLRRLQAVRDYEDRRLQAYRELQEFRRRAHIRNTTPVTDYPGPMARLDIDQVDEPEEEHEEGPKTSDDTNLLDEPEEGPKTSWDTNLLDEPATIVLDWGMHDYLISIGVWYLLGFAF